MMEQLSHTLDHVRRTVNGRTQRAERSDIGQFLTPAAIARFMASIQAALIVSNPDKPARPTNSPKAVYRLEPSALKLLRGVGRRGWKKRLREYLHTVESLNKLYARNGIWNASPLFGERKGDQAFARGTQCPGQEDP